MYKLLIELSANVSQEGDIYIAECKDVGTVSQGETIDDALKNLKEATELYLDKGVMKQIKKSSKKGVKSRDFEKVAKELGI